MALLDPRAFLVRRPLPLSTFSIPSLAPLMAVRSEMPTAAKLLEKMPVQALPSTVSQPLLAALAPSTQVSSAQKARRDAEVAEAARRQALRALELEEQRRAKEAAKQRRALRKHFLATVRTHREAFLAFHKARAKSQTAMARGASKNQEVVERRRKALEEKSKKDRMKALKDHDMDAYVRLLEGHKNDRLTSLLAQTDGYLKELSKMIRGGSGEAVKAPRSYIGRGNRTWRRDREEKEAWEKRGEGGRQGSRRLLGAETGADQGGERQEGAGGARTEGRRGRCRIRRGVLGRQAGHGGGGGGAEDGRRRRRRRR